MKKKTSKTAHRPWANLPAAALLTIFRRTGFEQRFLTIPLVCKSWRSVSQHPHCWSSMIPDSIPPEKAFIKRSRTFLINYSPCLALETLIKNSGGGDAITSLYLSRLIYTNSGNALRLIADCCPNLKHISFLHCKCNEFVEEDIVELINKCRKLELIDFDYLHCVQYSSSLIQKLGNCLPHLSGLRVHSARWDDRWGGNSCPIAHDIAKYLPGLKLLNLAHSSVRDDELSSILSGCLELQYLNVMGSKVSNTFENDSCETIPEFYITSGCSTCGPRAPSEIADLSDFDQDERPKACDLFADFYEETDMSYDYQYYLLKEERSKAFHRGRAKDRKRRQFRILYGRLGKFDGRHSKLKPMVECKMPYANDLYVMPVFKSPIMKSIVGGEL